MRDFLLKELRDFLESHFRPGTPLLVGFSGGPDSSALLYLLKECCRFFPLIIHVAHIDHGWREESAGEADRLKKRVEELGFTFYLKRLKPLKKKGNREERGREERLAFFGELYCKLGCQALLLAHQAEDQAETVLKRVLEGASLMHLGGMQRVGLMREMVVWRPLLRVSRARILQWVKARGIEVVVDRTNLDPKFLRGRMRVELFPEMSRLFGKEPVLPLGTIGSAAHELKEYLERRVAPYLERVESRDGEVRLDLTDSLPMESVELKAVLRLLCTRYRLSLSLHAVELLCKLLNMKVSKKKILQKGYTFETQKGVLTIKPLPQ